MPQKFVNLLRVVHSHTSRHLRANDEFSSSFEMTNRVKQDYLISLFLFNFDIDYIIEGVLGNITDASAQMTNGENMWHPDYVDDCVLSKCTEHVQRALDRVTRTAASFNMLCFAPSKSESLLQNWTTTVPNFILEAEEPKP